MSWRDCVTYVMAPDHAASRPFLGTTASTRGQVSPCIVDGLTMPAQDSKNELAQPGRSLPRELREQALAKLGIGFSIAEVEQQLGVGRATLVAWARKSGIEPVRFRVQYTTAVKADALGRLRAAKKVAPVVEVTGIEPLVLRRWARAAQIDLCGEAHRYFSPEVRAQALELARHYASAEVVHRLTGIKAATVTGWARRAGVSVSDRKAALRHTAVLDHFRAGARVSWISRETGLSEEVVRDWGTAAGALGSRKYAGTKATAVEQLREGRPFAEVAQATGCPLGVLLRWHYPNANKPFATGPKNKRTKNGTRKTPGTGRKELDVGMQDNARDLLERGMPLVCVATELCIPLSALRRWAKQNKLRASWSTPTPLDDSTWERVLEMVGQEVPVAEIGAATGISVQRLWKRLKAENVDYAERKRRFGVECRRDAVARVLGGEPLISVARGLEARPGLIHGWLRAAGYPGVAPSGPYPDDLREKALQKLRDGGSFTSSAAELSIGRKTVANWGKKAGLDTPLRYTPETHLRALAAMRETGDVDSAHIELGVPRGTLRIWARKEGVPIAVDSRKKWSAKTKARALKLLVTLDSIEKVHRATKVPIDTLNQWARRAGLRGVARAPTVYDQVLKLLRTGASSTDVAKATAVDEQTVVEWGSAVGVFEVVKHDETLRLQADALHKQGHSAARIAQLMEVSLGTAAYWAHQRSGAPAPSIAPKTKGTGCSSVHPDVLRHWAMDRLCEGISLTELAIHSGLSRSTLVSWARKGGVKPMVSKSSGYPADFQENALARLRGGEGVAAVAQDLGVHRRTLKKWAKEAGVKSVAPSKGYTESDKARSIASMRKTHQIARAHEDFGIVKDTLRRWAREEGILLRPQRRAYTSLARARGVELLSMYRSPQLVEKLTGIPYTTLGAWGVEQKVGATQERTPQEYADAMRLLQAGTDPVQVATELLIPENTVRTWGYASKVMELPPCRASRKADALAMLELGTSFAHVAQKTTIPIGVLVYWTYKRDYVTLAGDRHSKIPIAKGKQAIELVRRRVPVVTIAKTLGISRSALRAWLDTEGIALPLTRKAIASATWDKAFVMARSGSTAREIGEATGISAPVVRSRMRLAGVDLKRRPIHDEKTRARAVERVHAGEGPTAVARSIGTSRGVISSWLRAAGGAPSK